MAPNITILKDHLICSHLVAQKNSQSTKFDSPVNDEGKTHMYLFLVFFK